jgi:pimeloyl-ACP methyl ester carboxylesterase
VTPFPLTIWDTAGAGGPRSLRSGFQLTLARDNRVVMFDNSGVGRTQELPQPFSIDAMADQTSALIDAPGLGRPDVLGWSMGGPGTRSCSRIGLASLRFAG